MRLLYLAATGVVLILLLMLIGVVSVRMGNGPESIKRDGLPLEINQLAVGFFGHVNNSHGPMRSNWIVDEFIRGTTNNDEITDKTLPGYLAIGMHPKPFPFPL